MKARLLVAGAVCAVLAAAYSSGCVVRKSSGTTTGAGGDTSSGNATTGQSTGITGSTKASSAVNTVASTAASTAASTGSGSMDPPECDLNVEQGQYKGFSCFEAGTSDGKKACDACDTKAKTYCVGGFTCGTFHGLEAKCYRYCCDDGDCGTGKCLKGAPAKGLPWKGAESVGLCVAMDGMAASCDAPAAAKSMGKCVTLAGDVKCNPVTNEPCK